MFVDFLDRLATLLPLRMRYWVVQHSAFGGILVIRQRFHPSHTEGVVALDGPFDTTDDAARSLAFWIRQYPDTTRPRRRRV